ncbi:PH domain-containing protein [Jeotgalibacillus aurantiacus]|uniref:PH domain-containing protein n=1 Tax=Jeotgalibacillus aurantiacus TaxID=2763266 RepID=UPI001D0B3A3F|nr:PH domain-containing protein [Jeotgalibacillus aurantiacus]
MQMTLKHVQEQMSENDRILAHIRCSLDTYIYSRVARPGILAVTEKEVIFVANAVGGYDLVERYTHEKIERAALKKWIFSPYIYMKLHGGAKKFKHLMDENGDELVEIINQK